MKVRPTPHRAYGLRQTHHTAPVARPNSQPRRAQSTGQAQARAKARKAKAPIVIRPSLRQRLITRLVSCDFRPQSLAAKVPFVVLVISSLGMGLGITLWLSTDAAQRSYQLGNAQVINEALHQQKEALERDVLEAESAPALAEAARDLGMIPSRNTAHLVQDAAGQWVVIGEPKPAEGVPPPPLNTPLPQDEPHAVPSPSEQPSSKPGSFPEVPVRITPLTRPLPGPAQSLVPSVSTPEVMVRVPGATDQPSLLSPTIEPAPGASAITETEVSLPERSVIRTSPLGTP